MVGPASASTPVDASAACYVRAMAESPTLSDILRRSATWLAGRGIDTARLDAELLAAHALGVERLQLFLEPGRPLNEEELQAIRALVRRRGEREPLAWITGSKGFHAIDLQVLPGVLVPRPDTETIVEALLARIPSDAQLFLADIGCGTGAIGLALAHARPGIKLYAVDRSDTAIDNTRKNVAALGLDGRVGVLQGDLLAPIPPHRPVDIVVSNPPYIPRQVLAGLAPEVRREPALALDGGVDGLDVYRRLIPAAAARARIGVAVEIGHDQGRAVHDLFRQAGLQQVEVLQDLGRRDRVVLGLVPGAAWPRPVVRPQGERQVEVEQDDAAVDPTAPLVVEAVDSDDEPALDEEGNPLPVLDADR